MGFPFRCLAKSHSEPIKCRVRQQHTPRKNQTKSSSEGEQYYPAAAKRMKEFTPPKGGKGWQMLADLSEGQHFPGTNGIDIAITDDVNFTRI